ncbi:MAG: hypothetical protein ACO1QR_14605 [Chthoniobacteraceae bacterium]
MASDAIPTQVREFLRQHIQSVEQLEILLLVAASPEREWSIGAVYEVIRSSERSVTTRLEEFTAKGFLVCSPGPPATYRYAPKNEMLRSGVTETAKVYLERRVRVVEAIFSPDLDPLQGFADAFKFRNT